jgi:hypothetical protein
MMDANVMMLWNSVLSVLLAIIGFLLKEKFEELKRLDILLNKTREEVARDYTTNSEVQRITDHIDQRFNRLEAKIDQLIQKAINA